MFVVRHRCRDCGSEMLSEAAMSSLPGRIIIPSYCPDCTRRAPLNELFVELLAKKDINVQLQYLY